MLARSLLPLLLTLLAAAAPVPTEIDDPTTTEEWVRQQVKVGRVADLNERCGTPTLDIHDTDDVRWRNECRHVRPALLATLLIQADRANGDAFPVIVRNAYIDGRLDLEGAHVRSSQTALQDCWLDGDLVISDARFDGLLDLTGTLISGRFDGSYAFIAGRLMLIGSVLRKDITAPSMHIGSSAFLLGTQIGGAVMLPDARIDGQLDLEGSTITAGNPFDAERLSVGPGGLAMRKVVFGGPVILRDADVGGRVSLGMSHIAPHQNLDAQRLHAGAGGMDMQQAVFGGDVNLNNARIGAQWDLSGMNLAPDSRFSGEHVQVAGALVARDALFGSAVYLQALNVDGALDLRGSRLRMVSLEQSEIKADLVLGSRVSGIEKWAHWEPCDDVAPCLNLRNVRAVNLQDDERAWPISITLEGFTYTHLGGAGGDQQEDMRNRPVTWWHDWLQRDPVYSTQPYTQLATVLAAAGNRDAAAEIRFYSRDRQRSELLRGCRWLQSLGLVDRPDDTRPCGPTQLASWLGLSILQASVGYGIGGYGFRAVGWALVFALAGTVVLCFAPGVRGVLPVRFVGKATRGPRQKSLLWCFGASLNRILPLATISPEFGEFFNDPQRERLHAWQHVAFGVLALCGWALGLFVVAAFSGLIQN